MNRLLKVEDRRAGGERGQRDIQRRVAQRAQIDAYRGLGARGELLSLWEREGILWEYVLGSVLEAGIYAGWAWG